MKKITIITMLCLFLLIETRSQGYPGVGVNVPTGTPLKAALHVNGPVAIDTLRYASIPAYVLVLDANDSVLNKISLDSLALFLSITPQGYSDVVGWGYSVLNYDGNSAPPNSFFKDHADKLAVPRSNGVATFSFLANGIPVQERDVTIDWPSVSNLSELYIKGGAVDLGGYLYIAMRYGVTNECRVYRYDRNNLTSGGLQMMFSGLPYQCNGDPTMTSDGRFVYFSYNAGNTGNDNVVAKFSISGTTFTYISSKTIGTTTDFNRSFLVDKDENYYALGGNSLAIIKKYSSSGVLIRSSITNAVFLMNWVDQLYSLSGVISGVFEKFNK